MTPQKLEEYLNNIIKPALEEYAKENNISIEELLELSKQNLNNKSTNKDKSSHNKKHH